MGFLTSAVSAWAELRGRRYGGGVLKIEPGTLKRIPVPLIPGAEDVFKKLNTLLREGREEEARRIADERVLDEGLGLDEREIKGFEAGAHRSDGVAQAFPGSRP